MILNEEKEVECEASVDELLLEHVSECEYLEYILDESGVDEAVSRRKLESGRRIVDAISFLVNARDL